MDSEWPGRYVSAAVHHTSVGNSQRELQPLYYNDTAGDDISIAPAGFKDVDWGLDLGKDPVVANFGFSYQVEDELTATKHLTAAPPVPIGKMTWPVYRPLVNRTKGHLDQYGVHGYISSNNAWRKDEKWVGRSAYMIASQ